MKKKSKNKKGGYPYCYGYEDPDAFCRERAENGPTEEDEFTVCDTNTGNCVKPMGDVNRRRLRQQQQAIHQEEEEAEEQRINENLVNEFDEELFGDNADYGGGGRKIFRRKQKKKIGGYNSCLNFPNHDKYCRELSLSLSHLKGHTQCDTETGFCIKPFCLNSFDCPVISFFFHFARLLLIGTCVIPNTYHTFFCCIRANPNPLTTE